MRKIVKTGVIGESFVNQGLDSEVEMWVHYVWCQTDGSPTRYLLDRAFHEYTEAMQVASIIRDEFFDKKKWNEFYSPGESSEEV